MNRRSGPIELDICSSQLHPIPGSPYRRAFFISRVTMDPTDLGPGTAIWLGGTGRTLLGGFLWLRKFLFQDATDRAMDNADIGIVRRLNELLDSERQARKEAEARADPFAKERNELAAAVGRMERKIEALTGITTRWYKEPAAYGEFDACKEHEP